MQHHDEPPVVGRQQPFAGDFLVLKLWEDLWRDRWLVSAIVAGFTAIAVLLALLLPSWYRADVLLTPVEKKTAVNLSNPLLGSLASLAGLGVGGGDSAEAIAVLKSRDFARGFIKDQNLLPILFHRQWDAAAGKWKTDDVEDQPDLRDAVKYFDEKVRTVTEDRRTKLVRLSIEWRDPVLASRWANMLAERLNDTMRQRALVEAEANLEYLKGELAATNIATMRDAIARLVEGEMQKLMLARGNKDFAFRIVDNAEIPRRRSWPRRVLMVAGSIVLGAVAAVFVVLLRTAGGRSRQP